jgi:hypothetical protein
MIGAGLSYYNLNEPENYRAGNAKLYDGTFDKDIVANVNNNVIDPTGNTPFSILMTLNYAGNTNAGVFNIGFSDFTSQYFAVTLNSPSAPAGLQLWWRNGSGLLLLASLWPNTALTGINTFIITYSGGRNLAGCNGYKNGGLGSKTASFDTFQGMASYSAPNAAIGSQFLDGSFALQGTIRQLEIINRVATPAEIALASTEGSFRGANIALSDFTLAVDFNKTGTVDLTTIGGTPTYTITAVGGAVYTQFLP